MDTRWLRFLRRSARRTKQRIEALHTEIHIKEQMMADYVEQLRRLRAENTKLRRENHELVDQEDLLLKDNRSLADKLAAEQAKRVVADEEAKKWAGRTGELVEQLHKTAKRAAMISRFTRMRLLAADDEAPIAGRYAASFSVRSDCGSRATVVVAAECRQTLRTMLEPFTRLSTEQPAIEPQSHGGTEKECEGK